MRATVGEVSSALEDAFTRHQAVTRLVSGIYGAEYADDAEYARVQASVAAFAKDEGRPPRLFVAKLGQDGHDRGAKVIATAFADLGFAVEIGSLFQTPEEAAREAVARDVDVIGVSSLAAGHTTLVPALIAALQGPRRRPYPRRARRRHPAAGLRRAQEPPESAPSSAPAPTSSPPPPRS